jgi:protein-tyrosine-phosphatase
MREIGIDVSAERPQLLTPDLARDTRWLITMGCGDECPIVPGASATTGRSTIQPVNRSSACA